MSAPRVKLHPDGRVVVRALYALARPWLAVSSADEGGIYLDIEAFSDEAVRDWPNYSEPHPVVDTTARPLWCQCEHPPCTCEWPGRADTVPTGYYDERATWLWQTQGGVAR